MNRQCGTHPDSTKVFVAPFSLLICLIDQGSQPFCPTVASTQLQLGLCGTALALLCLLSQGVTLALLCPQGSLSLI